MEGYKRRDLFGRAQKLSVWSPTKKKKKTCDQLLELPCNQKPRDVFESFLVPVQMEFLLKKTSIGSHPRLVEETVEGKAGT